jgi:serralysin
MQQAAFRSALSTWSEVANLQFAEVPDSPDAVGDIRIAWTGLPIPPSDAWTWQSEDYWANAGDIWLSEALMGGQPTTDWQAGGFNYMALIHEVGHSLWLEHPFEGSSPLPATHDTNQYTVMSYTEHPNYLFLRYHPAVQEPDGSTNVTWDVIPIYPCTPMLLDVAAIQRLYGANMNWHTGDDLYTFDPDTPFIMTLWDAGGIDTISASNFSTDCLIDLREGQYSSLRVLPDPSVIGWWTFQSSSYRPRSPTTMTAPTTWPSPGAQCSKTPSAVQATIS